MDGLVNNDDINYFFLYFFFICSPFQFHVQCLKLDCSEHCFLSWMLNGSLCNKRLINVHVYWNRHWVCYVCVCVRACEHACVCALNCL